MALAVEQVRGMRGGAQSHLMRCSNRAYYVLKFQNNPQGLRILANELLGTRLAARWRATAKYAGLDAQQAERRVPAPPHTGQAGTSRAGGGLYPSGRSHAAR